MLTAIESILLVIIVTKATKSKGKVKETDLTWSQILFFPATVVYSNWEWGQAQGPALFIELESPTK